MSATAQTGAQLMTTDGRPELLAPNPDCPFAFDLLTVEQAAELVGVGVRTIWRRSEPGEWLHPQHYAGGQTRFLRSELLALRAAYNKNPACPMCGSGCAALSTTNNE